MKTKKADMKTTLTEFGRRALSVLLSVSMAFSSTPIAYAAEVFNNNSDGKSRVVDEGYITNGDGLSDANIVVPEDDTDDDVQVEGYDIEPEDDEQSEAQVWLELEHAYIHYKNQVIGNPTSSVTVTAGEEMRFSVVADDGYEIEEVTTYLDGTESVLGPDADDMYTIEGDIVQDGLVLGVKATGDPFKDESDTSVQAIDEVRNEEYEFVYEDDDIKVTATLTDPAALPADVIFKVTPVTPDSVDDLGNPAYNYYAYMDALNRDVEEGDEYTEENTLLYDVAFLSPKLDDEGEPIPDEYIEHQLSEGQVMLEFEFKSNQLLDQINGDVASAIVVEHLPLRDSVRSEVDSTATATDISDNDIIVERPEDQDADADSGQVYLNLDSLSVLAVRSIPLGTYSLNVNGEKSGTQVSTDLADFLTNVRFDAPINENGEYEVKPGDTYHFRLTFREHFDTDGIDTIQFPNGDVTLTYDLPGNLEVAESPNGYFSDFTINFGYKGIPYSITENKYRIVGVVENGVRKSVLEVKFNRRHENFSKYAAMANVQFSLDFEGGIEEDADELLFTADIVKKLDVDTSNSVEASKIAHFNKRTNQMDYTVHVRSYGVSKNVNVHDVITCDPAGLLKIDRSSIEVSSNKGTNLEQNWSVQDKEFTYEIPRMVNNEWITIKYSADIDYSLIHPNADAQYISTSSNRVEVKSKDDTEGDWKDISSKIDYTPGVSKSNGIVTDEHGDSETLSWTIEANRDPRYSISGSTITDTIDENSQDIMSYSGTGINIVVKDASGTEIRRDSVAWSNLTNFSNVLTDGSGKTWTYTIPETDSDHAYSYTITYTTEADFSGATTNTTVKNGVTTSFGGGDSGSSTWTGSGSEPGPGTGGDTDVDWNVSKRVADIDIDKREVTWLVKIKVPASGLDSAVVTDTCPQRYIYSGPNPAVRYDRIISNSIEVTGLIGNETYIEDIGETNATITFYKFYNNANDYQTGLCEGNERTVTVRLKTRLDDYWLEQSRIHEDLQDDHENKVTLEVGGRSKTASAIAIVTPREIKKQGSFYGNKEINGVNLPVYKFEIIVSDVNSDDNEFEDVFDNTLFVLDEQAGHEWNSGYVFGGTQWSQDVRGGKFTVTSTPYGLKFNTNADCMPHDANGNYYACYKLVYYLRVRDAAALEKIRRGAIRSDNGKYQIRNSVTFEGMTDTVEDLSYEYEGLTKEILTEDKDLTKTDQDIWADFRVTINSGAEMMNDGLPLTMTDTVENLSIDVTSIEAKDGVGEDAQPVPGVSWDMTGNTVTYTVPDSTKVVITYRARVILTDIGESGETKKIDFRNTAQLKGYRKEINKTAWRKNEGAGFGNAYAINLLKYEAGDMTKTLAGAKFLLLNQHKVPMRDKDGNVVQFVSGANGKVEVFGDMEVDGWALNANEKFYLQEIEAPVGYMLNDNTDNMYEFQISEDGTTDYSRYIYHSGDTMTVKNYPGTDVRVKKVWSDGNGKHDGDSVEVTLQQRLGNTNQWSSNIRREDNGVWVNDTEPRTLTLDKENDWSGIFNKLPLSVPEDINDPDGDVIPVTYRVIETKVHRVIGTTVSDTVLDASKWTAVIDENESDSVSYEYNDENSWTIITNNTASGTYEFTLENKVDTGDLAITKSLADGTTVAENQKFEFKVTLSGTTTPLSGTYSDMTFTNNVATVLVGAGETKRAAGLPAGTHYEVSEIPVDGFEVSEVHADSVSNDGATVASGDIVKDVEKNVEFVNAREELGKLTISKTLVSDVVADANQEFTFTVTLGDTSVNEAYSDVQFTNGVGTVTLKGGESKTIEGLPTGITYTVKETPVAGYVTIPAGREITEDITSNSEANFTNTRETGKLTVSKTLVSDVATDANKVFTFTITLEGLTGEAANKEYNGVQFTNGEATITLKRGESKTITGLPTGIRYTVQETSTAGYVTTPAGGVISGEISSNSEAAFINTRETGSLKISKTLVSEAAADADQVFTFTVTLGDTTINKAYSDVQFTDGVGTVTLKGGESKTIEGLPAGITYTVAEDKDNNGDFETVKSGDTGTISTTLSEAVFENTRRTGSLEVKKAVPNGDEQSAGDTFSFTVTLDDKTIGGKNGKKYGDMTFVEGVATFELSANTSAKATGLPTGVGYTVEETPAEGYVTTPANGIATGDITTNGASEEFVNTRVEKGDLIVSKTVVSRFPGDNGKEFEFTVQLSDHSISGTYGDMNFNENGMATFKLKNRESKTATGLPKNVSYRVTEVNGVGFDSDKPEVIGIIGDRTVASAAFTNTRKTGDLEISKAVVSDAAADKNQVFTFNIALDPAIAGAFGTGSNQVTFDEKGEATITLKGGEKKTISGLPYGVEYTVTEATVTGFTPNTTNVSGTITGPKAEAAFTNTRDTGNLEVTKKVDSRIAADKNLEFEFTVTLSDLTIGGDEGKTYKDMTFKNGVATFKLKDNESATAEGLPVGITYTVVEKTYDKFTTTSANHTGTIASDRKMVAAFTNTRKTGNLEISKAVVSDAAADKNQVFTFNIALDPAIAGAFGTGSNQVTFDEKGEATITLKGGEEKTISGLPYGVGYEVTEATADGFTLTNKEGYSGNIAAGKTKTAAFTNTRNTGSLKVEKTLKSDLAADAEKTFEFTITLSDKTITKTYDDGHDGVAFTNGVATVTLKGGEQKTITGLPVGIKYTVEETADDDFTTTMEGETGEIATTESTASFTNTRNTGELVISKKLVSEAAADANQAFGFTVKLAGLNEEGLNAEYSVKSNKRPNTEFNGIKFNNGEAHVTVKGGEEVTIEGLPYGVTYTVTEDAYGGFVTDKTGDTGTISATPSEAEFTNTRKLGELEVSKKVVSDAAADKNVAFTFTVTLDDNTIGGDKGKAYGDMTFTKGVATFTLKDNESKKASNLPTGIGYTVTEEPVTGFQNTKKDGYEGTIGTELAKAEFTNERDLGGLIVEKNVKSDATADKTRDFEFTVTLSDTTITKKYDDMDFVNGVATFTLKDGKSAKATGLPIGVTYTVTETSADGFTTSSENESGTIVEGASKHAVFTNTRETGDLKVSKEVISDADADASQVFTFTVELSDKTINKTYSDVVFANGVGTVTLKGGESKTIEGLPTDVDYTVTEAAAVGFQVTGKTGDTGTISKTQSEAKFTNTRDTGDLVVSKVLISDAAADANQTFKFTITLSDTSINGTYGEITFANGVATVELKGGESRKASGLPTGVTYEVKEDTVTGFRQERKTGDTGAITGEESGAYFTNARETGSLKISKVVVSDAAADKQQVFTFTIKLSDESINKTYSDVEFAKGVGTVTLKGGESKTLEGLPTGVTYTVTEAQADGFQVTGKTGDTGTISTTLSEAAFTNTRDKGDIKISKEVVSDAAADADQVFTFTIELSDTSINKTYSKVDFTDGVGTVTLKGGESKTISGLPTDITYTVSEATAEGFVTDAEGETGTVSTTLSEVVFTNTHEKGNLEISKTLVSGAAADADTEFTFTVELSDKTITGTYGDVTFTAGFATVTVKGGESKTATGLPTGITYTVTESTNDAYETEKTGEAGTIATGTTKAAFTNTRKTGGFTLTKELISNVAADADQAFTFHVEFEGLTDDAANGTYGNVQLADGKVTVTLKGGESWSIVGLPIGTTYTITEDEAEGFYNFGKVGDTGAISATQAEATFTNKRETSGLVISKTLVSDAAADADQEFTFTVTLGDRSINKTYSDVEFKDGVATVTLKGGESKLIEGLPEDITYQVSEDDVEGFAVTSKTGEQGTIAKDVVARAAFTNTRDTGSLKVSKELVSEAAADADRLFEFTVTLTGLSDTAKNKTYGGIGFVNGVGTFTLKGGESRTITDLPTGITYTVTEATADGFTVTGKTGDTGAISVTESVATFTNTRKTGDLEVSKELVSDVAADSDQKFAFTVTLSDKTIGGTEGKAYGDMTFTKGVATFELKGGEKATAEGLPTGITYTVEETEFDNFVTTSEGASGTISVDTSVAAFTNTREKGKIKISKTVVSDAAADAGQVFTFTIKLSDESINKTYSEVEFKNGVGTITLKGGEHKTISGLPVGIDYTVTEAEAKGFKTASERAVGTITTVQADVDFTNTRETGELTVSKKLVSDAAADSGKDFTFTVELSDKTIGGNDGKAYGDMIFRNGVATFTLKGGQTAVAKGLPTDVTYKVTEVADDDFTTEKSGDEGTISTTGSVAEFTNTRKTGDLEVSKTVVSDATADKGQEFMFTVTLSDATIGGEEGKAYGDMTFTNGVARINLKGGDTATATGLPTGVSYTVEETANTAFDTQKTGDTGVISTEKAEAKFTNTRKTGNLVLSKVLVSDAAADKEQEFTFTITLADKGINSSYSDVEFKGGVATVTLKGGESKTIEGLPTGVDYTITEADVTGFQNTNTVGGAGTISTEPAQAIFTNERDRGGLIVAKTLVSDATADATQKFEFKVELSDKSITATYDDMTFKNGIATFRLAGGETAKATGLPIGITYTVTETAADGYTTASTDASGQIVEGKTQRAVFTNTRETGDLEVSKTVVSDAAADKDQLFNFTVKLFDEKISKKYGDVEFTNGVTTFTLKGGESKTIKGLPTGITYEVIEAEENNGDFATEKSGDKGTISTSGSVAAFTNTRETGSLEVSKSLVSDAAADKDQVFTFTIALSDTSINKTYSEVEFKNGVGSVTLKGGESKTVEGLPTGITYAVSEAEVEGFVSASTGATGTISDSKASAVFTNTRETGKLTVSKTVVSDAAADKNQEFTFTITLSDDTIDKTYSEVEFAKGVGTVTLKGGESKTIEGLPTGVTYEVSEAKAEGFATDIEGEAGTISATESVAAFTNTRETGDLSVSKEVVSDVAADADQVFTFTITLNDETINKTYSDVEFKEGVGTVTLKGGESKTIEGLPTGVIYTVREAATEGFSAASTGARGTISKTLSKAQFTNTRETGDLEISKAVVSDAAADREQVFTFTITLSDTSINKTYSDVEFTDGVGSVTLKHNESKTVSGLPTGIGYVVTEATVDGFVTASDGATGAISATLSKAQFTNTRETGDLEISKAVVSDAAADADTEFTFTVELSDKTITGTYGDVAFTAGVGTVNVRAGESKTASGLPTGITYTVTESAYDAYETAKTGEAGAIATGTATAAFTNTRKTGGLKLSKELASNATAYADQVFTFHVRFAGLSAEAANAAYGDVQLRNGEATVELKGGESWTIEGLPVGTTYTITEDAAEGFHISGKVGDTGAISATQAEATFTNERDSGGLVISKTLVSDAAADADQEFTFTVTLSDTSINKTYSDVEFKDGVATVTLKGGESKEIEGLPEGVSYEITEAEVDGFELTSQTGETGTIEANGNIPAAFTNTRDTGSLKVSKELVSEAAADADRLFEFTVTLTGLSDAAKNKTYGDVEFTDGVATFSLRGGESRTIEGLPTGIGYAVSEAAADGFTVTGKTGDTGTISATESVATFTNTRETGSIEVSKQLVSDVAADAGQAFAFTVTLSDATIGGEEGATYGDMTFTKGVATFELKGGEKATAEGLPTGITYTVAEAASDGFVTTSEAETGIVTTTTSEVTFTNTRQVGSLRISKSVSVDGEATTSTVADGTYTFVITGEGDYRQGVSKVITITNGRSQTLTIDNLPEGVYTITEQTNGLPSNMHLIGPATQTVNVTANNDQEIPVAYFYNDLSSVEANVSVTKRFDNWENIADATFGFRLTPEDNAPMPSGSLVPNVAVATATEQNRIATFNAKTYTQPGTYTYKLVEVVPEGADENGVYKGIGYDLDEHTVTVEVAAGTDGNLTAEVTYDEDGSAFSIANTYEATGEIDLKATKTLAGRAFTEGDAWTFVVSQPEGQGAPMPENTEVTIDAMETTTADFGTIRGFTAEDIGKSYVYLIDEYDASPDGIENVVNDTQKRVVVSVEDNGDGTLNVTCDAPAGGVEFVNNYVVERDLVVRKGIENREWKKNDEGEVTEDFEFELFDAGETPDDSDAAAAKREESRVATRAITRGLTHEAKFGTFTFTAADAGKTFTYQVREVVPDDAERITDANGEAAWVKDGVHYNEFMYDVTFSVRMDADGALQVEETYSQGENTLDALRILNTYQAADTEVAIEAEKILVGRDMEESDDFKFNLYYVERNGSEQLEETAGLTKTEDGRYIARFEPKRYTIAAQEDYIIREAIPEDAIKVTNADGTEVWEKNGVRYDESAHKVHVSVTDDSNGHLVGAVYYDDSREAYDAETNAELPVFTNTVFTAKADIEINKEYYGTDTNAEFTFVMTAADDEFKARENANGSMAYTESVVDNGQAFSVMATNDAFDGNVAKVHMPTINYREPGTYRYVITEMEDEDTTGTMSMDASEILVTVVVDDKGEASVTYQVRANGVTSDIVEGEAPTLFNNADVVMAFRSRAFKAQGEMARFTNFEPAVKKVLKNGILTGGEFKFAIYAGDKVEGEPLQVATNDENGSVSFNSIFFDGSNIGQTYDYTIVEVPTDDETVVFDNKAIRLTIKVTEGEDHEVIAEGTYSEATDSVTYTKTDDPTFVNTLDTIVIHAVKRSREEPYDPLAGAHYGLWMVNPNGEDVYMGLGRDQEEKEGSEDVSSANGDLYYDLPLLEGVAYYFLEEWPPPAGHLVDPYPTDYFTLVRDKEKGTFRLVYEADPDFQKYCPDIAPRL